MASMFAYDSMSRDSARRNPLASSVRAGYLGFLKSGLAKKEEGIRGGGEIRREKGGGFSKRQRKRVILGEMFDGGGG